MSTVPCDVIICGYFSIRPKLYLSTIKCNDILKELAWNLILKIIDSSSTGLAVMATFLLMNCGFYSFFSAKNEQIMCNH
jgi:hypothetical protein